MENWIDRQTVLNTQQFEKSMEETYPESKKYTRDPKTFLNRVIIECNYLNALKMIPFNHQIPPQAVVLDLAGGIGWLSGYLSRMDSIEKIYMVDSSKCFLEQMLPEVIKLMDGNIKKLVPIQGLFTPLLFENDSLDCVLVSSSLHHAENLETVLQEIFRVLKKGGILYILNETPYSYLQYLKSIIQFSLKFIINSFTKDYRKFSPSISSAGILYDPFLGDRMYPLWFWKAAIKNAGFQLKEVIDSGMSTLINKKGRHLVHFICEK